MAAFGSAIFTAVLLAPFSLAALPTQPSRAAMAGGRPAYTTKRGSYRSLARFRVSYSGSGVWQTSYRAEPPSDPTKPRGPHDTNDANDSSSQSWLLRYTNKLTIPVCTRPLGAPANPCQRLGLSAQVTGTELVAGRIAHSHHDGLFPAQNQSVRCSMRATPPHGIPLAAPVSLGYSAATDSIRVTALIPVAQALATLPGACPDQGDSLDGLYDNYFDPGFSFGSGYGSQRWFTSQTVVVPARIFHRAAAIAFRLSETAAGTPPANCAVANPSYERCSTGGSWAGVLTLKAAR